MAGRGSKWSREETLAALFLYLALPSKKVDDTNEDVQALAKAIGRTPGAVALKIWNLASFDERRRARGKVGMTHASKMDKMVWAEYSSAGDELVEEATEVFLNRFDFKEPLSDELKETIGFDLPEGKEREAIVSMRVNQEFFRTCGATTESRLRFRNDSPQELSLLNITTIWCLRGRGPYGKPELKAIVVKTLLKRPRYPETFLVFEGRY